MQRVEDSRRTLFGISKTPGRLADGGTPASRLRRAVAVITEGLEDRRMMSVAPTGVLAKEGPVQVALNWTAAPGAATYNVKRGTSFNGPFAVVAPSITTTNFTDTTVVAATQYYYVVTSNDGTTGESSNSAVIPGETASTTQAFSGTYWYGANNVKPLTYASDSARFGYGSTVSTINLRNLGTGDNPPNAPAGWNPNGNGVAFSAHWEGVIQAPDTDTYTLFAGADDGIGVTVDGTVLGPNNLNITRGYTIDTQTPNQSFVAGQLYNVQVDYNQGGGGWDATLEWVKTSDPTPLTSKVIVPNAVVYLPQPAQVVGLGTVTSNQSAVLTWTADRVQADSYKIYRSLTGAPGTFTSIGTSTSTTFTDTGLTNGQAYTYMVAGVNASGEGSSSVTVAATPSNTAPAAPTNVKTVEGTDQVTLSWTAPQFATTYNVKRSTTIGGTYTTVAGGTVSGTTFTDTTVTPGTQYYYVITASTPTSAESATSLISPGRTLSTTQAWSGAYYYSNNGSNPRIYSASNAVFGYYGTTATINLRGKGVNDSPPGAPSNWNPNGNGNLFAAHWEGIIKIPFTDTYSLFTGSDDGQQTVIDGVIQSPNNINADRGYVEDAITPQTLNAGQYYDVEVNYNQGGGGWDASVSAQGSNASNPLGTTKGIVPQAIVYLPQAKQVTGLTGAGNNGTVQLNWSRTNVTTSSYNIYRATSPTGPFTLAGSTVDGNTTTFSNTGLTNGTTYYFVVTSVNGSGESPLSSVLTATPALAAPAAPLNPAAVTTISGTVPPKPTPTVKWSSQFFTDTYNVYRSTSATGTYTKIAQGLTGTSYVDTDPALAFGNTYFYKVSGSNTIGESVQTVAVSTDFTSGAEFHVYNNQWWKSGAQDTTGYTNISSLADFKQVRQSSNYDDAPDPSIGPNNWSQVATGKIHVNTAGTYTFVSATDDDGYLFVNGQLVASETGGHGTDNAYLGAVAGSTPFNAGTPVPLTLAVGDYDFQQFMAQGGGGAGIHFRMVDPANANNIIAVPNFGTAGAAVTYSNTILSSTPATPTGVSASPGSANDVALTWTDVATSELHYQIQRSTSQTGPFVIVGTVGLHDNGDTNSVQFTDVSTQPATTYWYRVVGDNFDAVGVPSAPVSVLTAGPAQGLEAHYYSNKNYNLPGVGTLTAPVTRVDPQVSFAAGNGLPLGGTAAANISARWTGKVLADNAGKYSFTLNTDDGSRLYVDGVKVVDSYFDKGENDVTGAQVTLTAGYHDIMMEWYQGGGGLGATLKWNPADATGVPVAGVPAIIPQDHLQSVQSVPANPTALAFPLHGANAVTLSFTDNAVSEIGYTVERSTDSTFATNTSTLAFLTANQFAATGTVTYTDTTIAPSTQYYYRIQGLNYDGASAVLTGTTTTSAVVTGGVITGTSTATPALTDLTALGTLDWAHYGLSTAGSFNDKVGATQKISNVSLIGGDVLTRDTGNPNSFIWSDGTPVSTVSPSSTGVFTSGLNNGLRITAPADTTDRVLKVYIGVFNSKGTLTAKLSDGSATAFSDATYINLSGVATAVYTLTYHAGSANQQILVDWVNTQNNGGNVKLEAAVLGLTTDFIAPTVTSILQTDGKVRLTLLPNTTTQTGFEIQRSSDGVNFTTVSTVGASTTTFTDPATGLTPYKTYQYRVRALGTVNSGYGSPSSIVFLPITASGQHPNGFAFPSSTGVTLDGLAISGGFENPALAANSINYNAAGGPWTFNGTTGILNGTTGFGASPAVEGTQVAFLQSNTGDSRNSPNGQYASQTVNFASAGLYVFSDFDASRNGFGTSSYSVVLDFGTPNAQTIFTSRATSNAWTQHMSLPFTATAGSHELRLISTGPDGTDTASFVDAVRIVPQASYAALAVPFQDLQLNGAATFQAPTSFDTAAGYLGRLRLTSSANGQTSSAFERVATDSLTNGFNTTFDFQFSKPSGTPADGFTFTLQGNGPTALGGGGGAVGFDGIPNSLAVYFTTYPAVSHTGIGINGVKSPFVDIATSPVGDMFAASAYDQTVDANPASHLFRVTLNYNATAQTLAETLLDVTASTTFTTTYTGVNLATILGGPAVYAGFTGATGGENLTQDVLNWSLTSTVTAPSLVSTTLDDGTAQRSMNKKITFVFDKPVTLSGSALSLSLLNTGGSGLNDNSAPTNAAAALATPTTADGGLTWVYTFAPGAFTEANGSLKDGIYTLTLNASGVTGPGSLNLAASSSLTFHRLFGDIDGGKSVNNTDLNRFRSSFNASTGNAAYNPSFDFDSGGSVNNTDLNQFGRRFNVKSFSYT